MSHPSTITRPKASVASAHRAPVAQALPAPTRRSPAVRL